MRPPIYVDDVVRLLAEEGHSPKEAAELLGLPDERFVRRIADQEGLTPAVLEAARRRRRDRMREAKKGDVLRRVELRGVTDS